MRKVFLSALVLVFTIFAFNLLAQTLEDIGVPSSDKLAPSGTETSDTEMPTFDTAKYTVESFTSDGGWCMWAILFVMIAGFCFTVERTINLVFRYRTDKVKVYTKVVGMLREGRVDSAKEYLRDLNTPLANVMFAAVNRPYGNSEAEIQKAIDESFLQEYPKLTRFLGYLATIANVATLLGLLGTIFGLIMAFYAVSNVPAAKRTQALAIGIQVAMATTAFGLITAIPTLVVHGWLSAQSESLTADIDEISVRLLNFLTSKG
jgi:biopolymer transport protein ExbB